ncbi:uncharacterized protein I206_107097 [Kwoniella pini CBS 10737]|uniref:Uncharacterized protein n=1 Tax=Kwoniella pini CBS 10737 TaxID=1296096 RepID=A0A1B9HZ98_9TREE|nr:uncharacterized protein I206_05359 [Kwoniella pini CBS 10737]OCF48580.1 hypothetical protein I206_05359 [Kwoniella pini CBS 10737]
MVSQPECRRVREQNFGGHELFFEACGEDPPKKPLSVPSEMQQGDDIPGLLLKTVDSDTLIANDTLFKWANSKRKTLEMEGRIALRLCNDVNQYESFGTPTKIQRPDGLRPLSSRKQIEEIVNEYKGWTLGDISQLKDPYIWPYNKPGDFANDGTSTEPGNRSNPEVDTLISEGRHPTEDDKESPPREIHFTVGQ